MTARSSTPAPASAGSLPADPELERAVLGGLLIDRDAIFLLLGRLRPEHFFDPAHQAIYAAIITLAEGKVPPDTHLVARQLAADGQLDNVGGLATLIELVNEVPTAVHSEYYADQVIDLADQRALISAGLRIASLPYDEPGSAAPTLLDRAESLLVALRSREATSYEPVIDALARRIDRLTALSASPGAHGLQPTGFVDLDRRLGGGLDRGDLALIAARPAVGKTALLLSSVRTMIRSGVPVAFFSMEMSADQLVDRLLSMETGITVADLRAGRISAERWEQLEAATARIASWPLFLDATSSLSLGALRARAARLVAMHGVRVVVLDYIQLMTTGRRAESRLQEVSEVSRGVKAIARDLRVSIVAACQLSRAVEGRADHIPNLSDLRETGSFEQDSDLVAFVHRPALYDERLPAYVAQLIIGKNRQGETGRVDLHWKGEQMLYSNLALDDDDEIIF